MVQGWGTSSTKVQPVLRTPSSGYFRSQNAGNEVGIDGAHMPTSTMAERLIYGRNCQQQGDALILALCLESRRMSKELFSHREALCDLSSALGNGAVHG